MRARRLRGKVGRGLGGAALDHGSEVGEVEAAGLSNCEELRHLVRIRVRVRVRVRVG